MPKGHLFYFGLIVVIAAFVEGIVGAHPDGGDPAGGYHSEFHKPEFDILLGKVTLVARDDRAGIVVYELRIIGDMRGTVKPGSTVKVKGSDGNTFSAVLNIPRVDTGSLVAFPATAAPGSQMWQYCAMGTLPIGLDSAHPVPAGSVIDVAVALKELGAALEAPGAAGPSRERVSELLRDRNPYLWDFGAWRLSKDADLDDLAKLKSLFFQPGLTPAQALWVDSLFDTMTGPASAYKPTPEEHRNLLRRFLENYIKETGEPAPTPRGR